MYWISERRLPGSTATSGLVVADPERGAASARGGSSGIAPASGWPT